MYGSRHNLDYDVEVLKGGRGPSEYMSQARDRKEGKDEASVVGSVSNEEGPKLKSAWQDSVDMRINNNISQSSSFKGVGSR